MRKKANTKKTGQKKCAQENLCKGACVRSIRKETDCKETYESGG